LILSMIGWEAAVNHQHISYTNNFARAQLSGSACSIRTPFFSSGRYIFSVKVLKSTHAGVGVATKEKNFDPNNWIGSDEHSWCNWDNGGIFHLGKSSHDPKVKAGVIVTVDLNIEELMLNIAVEGKYYPQVALPHGKEFALAASLWGAMDSVELIQFMKMA